MEREDLGIQNIIKEGIQKPDETARLIARILVRDIWATIHQHDEQNHYGLNPLEQVALVTLRLQGTCRQVAQRQVQESFIPSIKLLIQEYISGTINVVVSPELQKMVAHAVLELIAASVSKKGFHELAHGIQNEPNAVHLLRNPTRIMLLDHGIIHANPKDTHSDGTRSSLWTGHRTNREFQKNGTGDTNIYVEVTPGGELRPILEGNRIISGIGSELIVFTDNQINFHSEPRLTSGKQEGFTAPLNFSTNNTIGDFHSIVHKSVANFVGWNGYILRGKNETGENQIVICIRTAGGENDESFSSHGKIFTLDNVIIVIENDGYYILTKHGKQKIGISVQNIVGIRKIDGKNESLYLIADGKKQKMVIQDEEIRLVEIDSVEEPIFN